MSVIIKPLIFSFTANLLTYVGLSQLLYWLIQSLQPEIEDLNVSLLSQLAHYCLVSVSAIFLYSQLRNKQSPVQAIKISACLLFLAQSSIYMLLATAFNFDILTTTLLLIGHAFIILLVQGLTGRVFERMAQVNHTS